MRKLILYTMTFTVIIFSTHSFANNECVGIDGKVSFQDKPCPKITETSSIMESADKEKSPPGTDIRIIDLDVEGGKQFSVRVPASWKPAIRNPTGILAPTLRVKPSSGDDITLLMTFIPIKSTGESTSSLLNKVMAGIERQHGSNSSERKLATTSIKQILNDGEGSVITYIDDALAKSEHLPGGEFVFVTAGAVILNDVLVNITILTNDLQSDNYGKAIAAILMIMYKNT